MADDDGDFTRLGRAVDKALGVVDKHLAPVGKGLDAIGDKLAVPLAHIEGGFAFLDDKLTVHKLEHLLNPKGERTFLDVLAGREEHGVKGPAEIILESIHSDPKPPATPSVPKARTNSKEI
jgi:hypothetical protein